MNLVFNQVLKTYIENSVIPQLEKENRRLQKIVDNLERINCVECNETFEEEYVYNCLRCGKFFCYDCMGFICNNWGICHSSYCVEHSHNNKNVADWWKKLDQSFNEENNYCSVCLRNKM